MPHSSGGGSHGGGGHSGGGSHGGGSRGPSPTRISSTPYPGARRFRYRTRFGGYRYFYTTREPGKIFHPARLLIGLFYIPFIAAGVGIIASPIKKSMQKYDRNIVVIDKANVLEDDSRLMSSLNAFSEKTKITPAVITINNEDWQQRYSTLEDYAYDRYLAEFNDEMHWLIVYSEPSAAETAETPEGEAVQADENTDWYWEGMQGDDTDPVLTTYVTGQFNKTLQTALEAGNAPLGENLASAFDVATAEAGTMSRMPHLSEIGFGLFVLAFVGFHAFFMLGLNELKYRKAELDPDDPGVGYDPSTRFNPAAFSGQPQFGSQQQFNTQPFGTQQQFNAQQPTGMQQPFGAQQAFGTPQQSFVTPQPTGMQQPFGAQQTFGTPQQTVTPLQQFGMPQPLNTPQPGTQPAFGGQQGFGAQQPFAMPQPAPETPQQSFDMPDLMNEPPKAAGSAFAMPQLPDPPQFDTPQFDAQLKQFDMQQEQFEQQQRQFEMQQKQFEMPASQSAAPAFKIPEFPQPAAQPAKETCRFCGMQYFSGVKYCPGCGAEVSDNLS